MISLFRRRSAPPPAVRETAGLRRGEKVIGSAELSDGAWALATVRRLLVVQPGSPPRVDRAWHQVDNASWDGDSGTLSVVWVTGERSWLTLADAGDLEFPALLRERVDATVVSVEHVSARGQGARVVVRRTDDGLVLQELLDARADRDDPALVRALAEARAQLVDRVGPLSTD